MKESDATAAPKKNSRLACIFCAVVSVVIACAWQAAKVHYSYNGNWTALYNTGSEFPIPPALEHENIYRLAGSYGYDGQFYHYIAHDPFFTRGFAAYIDAPRLRYRRILVPGLAFVLAFGRQRWIDLSYDLVTLIFVFVGVYWTAAYASRAGFHPAWGLLFLLAPAILISLNRLTVDTSLAALSAGYALYSTEEPSWQLFLVLAFAPLARETGIILAIAYGLWSLWHSRIATAAVTISAPSLPWLGWWWFVSSRTSPDPTKWISWPFSGLLHRIITPAVYQFPPIEARVALVSDYIALAGILLAFGLCAGLLSRLTIDPIAIACYGFLAIGMLLANTEAWFETPAFGRTFSPLLLLLPLWGVPRGFWVTLAPLALTLPWSDQKFLTLTFRIIQHMLT
jgi:hypothetical protein